MRAARQTPEKQDPDHIRQSCHWPPRRSRLSMGQVQGGATGSSRAHDLSAGRPARSARQAVSTTKGKAMSNIAPLLDRNRAFASDPGARQGMPRLPFIPNLNLYIVTCIDCRVDPAQILGVKLGEALVQRNIGGRITPAIIADIAYAGYSSTPRPPKAPTSRSRSSTTPTAARPCSPTTTCATASPSESAPTSGPWPTRPSWTRPAPSRPTSTGCYGRRKSRTTSTPPGTSTTLAPAWSPPSSTQEPGSNAPASSSSSPPSGTPQCNASRPASPTSTGGPANPISQAPTPPRKEEKQ